MQKKLLQTTALLFIFITATFWLQVSYAQNPAYVHNFPPETGPGVVEIGNGLGNFPNVLNQDHFGSAVANIGDLDGDGVPDIAVGAYSDASNSPTTVGMVYIIFMQSDGTVKKVAGVPQYTKFAVSGAQNFGISIANIGDIDGDGINDIAVGANADAGAGGYKLTGSVYICFLKKTGALKGSAVISGASMPGWVSSAQQAPIQFGKRVALIGDVNGDGINDIVVGADQDKSGSPAVPTGSAFIIFLDTKGAIKAGTTPIRIDKNNNTGSPSYIASNDIFGSAVAGIGDFDGDGVPDIAIGAQQTSAVKAKSGAIYIIYLNKTGIPKAGTNRISNATPALNGILPASELFGCSIAYLKDFNYGPNKYRKKGVKVLAVGSYTDNDYAAGAGAIWLLFFDSGTSNVLYYQKISGKDPNIKANATINAGDNFGYSVCNYQSRDTNSTQRIVVGAFSSVDGNASAGTGTVYVIDFRKFNIKMDSIWRPIDTICANSTQHIAIVYENKSNQPTYGFNLKVDVSGTSAFTLNQYVKKKDTVGQKDTAYFTANFPTSTPGTYILKAAVQMNGDFDPLNDSINRQTFVLKSLTVPTFGKDTVYLCQGDTVPLDLLNAGAQYNWYKNAASISNQEKYTIKSTGNYIGIAKIGSCSASDTIQVNYRPSAVVNIGPDQTICYGDSTMLNAGYPGSTHRWYDVTDPTNPIDTNQKIVIKNNNSATYRATVDYISHGGHCLYDDTVSIIYNHVVVDLGPDTVLCVGQKYILDAKNPNSHYTWFRNGVKLADTLSTFTDSVSGTYAVTVKNGNCFGFDTVKVTFLTVPSVSLAPNFDTLCKSGTRILNAANPGYKHYWSINGVPITLSDTTTQYKVTGPGYYRVLVANSQGAKCNAQDAATITYNILSVFILNVPSITLCQGTTQKLNANVSSTINDKKYYKWYRDGNPIGTTGTYTVTAPGKYWVVVNVGQCTAISDTLQVFYTPIVQPYFGNSDTLLCQGTSITLDAGNPGARFDWSTPKGTKTTEVIKVDTAGFYTVTVTNAACTKTNSIRVKYTNISINLGSDTTLCFGRPIPLDAKNSTYFDPVVVKNSLYQWYDNGTPITGATTQRYNPTTAGTYKVVVFQKYCLDSGSIKITFRPSPIVYRLDTTICNNDSLILDAGNPGCKVYWYPNGDTTHKIKIHRTISPTAIRHYKAYVTNGSCTDTSFFNVGFFDSVYFQHWRPEIYLCDSLKGGVTLDAGSAVTYDWEPTGDQKRYETITAPGKYTVKISNIGGCSRMDSVKVFECPVSDLLIPNIFTPNKDDVNDSFRIYNLNSQEYLLTIYNRWGEQVFYSTNPNKAWDGNFNGDPVPEGVYKWTLVYRLKTAIGTPPRKIVSGTLMLLRP